MKKSILYFLTAIMLFAVSCSESYDDSALVGRVDNLENRVAKLEELCKQMNTNISSLQSLVTALQNNDYVTGVTPITKNGETIGYTITFTKSQPITIYHGEDGKDGVNGTDGQDGHTPVIGVKQDTDGIYYWTLDGDWLLDDVGNKIKAQGTDGQNGADGKDGEDGVDGVNGTDGKDGENGTDGKDGITPQLKIDNDYWYISYDNGSTWTQLGKATGKDGVDGTNGENGDSFFQGVNTNNSDYVIFTLADGTELVLPRHKNLSISFDIADGAACMPSASIKVGYKLTGADSGTTIETIGDGGWKSVVTKTSISSGYITVTAPESGDDGKVVMLATTSNGFTAMKAITFEEGVIMDVSDAYQANYENSTLEVTLRTNLAYTVSIPDDAKSWISVADTRASIRAETLTFTIKENPEENPVRYATIKLIGECGDMLQSFVIMQDYQPSSNPIVFADANVKKVCVEKYDTNGDGELSEKEAAAVTEIEKKFFGDYEDVITSFDELQYFKSLEELNQVFWGCSNLKSVTVPEGVTLIGRGAFYGCSSLANIIIPKGVTSIDMDAFSRCLSLKNITLPEGVVSIGISAFSGCSLLANITIPKSVISIGDGAFSGCSSLTSIIIPEGVTSIGDGAFSGCSSLTSIIIPEGVTSIGDSAFSGCSSLTSITIPDSIISIGDSAFSGCSSLTAFYGKYASADNRCLIVNGNLIAYAPVGLTSYTIPSVVTSIGDNAFSGCSSLISITIPDSVTSIGYYAFYDCSSLTSIIIPNGVSSIVEYAFYNCLHLETIYSKNPTPPTLGSGVFQNCFDVSKIYVPTASVEAYKADSRWKDYADKIVGYDFENDTEFSLSNQIWYEATSKVIPDEYAGFGANIVSNAYEDGNGAITFDGDVTLIGNSAFIECESLTSITIPESVTDIADYAFYGCSSLKSVYCKQTTPPILGTSVFFNNATGRKFYVPKASVNSYKVADGWTDYAYDIVGYDF